MVSCRLVRHYVSDGHQFAPIDLVPQLIELLFCNLFKLVIPLVPRMSLPNEPGIATANSDAVTMASFPVGLVKDFELGCTAVFLFTGHDCYKCL